MYADIHIHIFHRCHRFYISIYSIYIYIYVCMYIYKNVLYTYLLCTYNILQHTMNDILNDIYIIHIIYLYTHTFYELFRRRGR